MPATVKTEASSNSVKKEAASTTRRRTKSKDSVEAAVPLPTVTEDVPLDEDVNMKVKAAAPRRVSPAASVAPTPRPSPSTTTTGVAKTHAKSPMSAKPHDEELTMASGLVLDHFGPTVQSVFDCLAMKGDLPFLAVLAYMKKRCSKIENMDRTAVVIR